MSVPVKFFLGQDCLLFSEPGPDTRNYLRISFLVEIEFVTTGASMCGISR